MSECIYYVYAYIREDGTPYYIGKGKDARAWSKDHFINLPPLNRIKILESNLTDVGACAIERRLIRWHGRKNIDVGGILYNQAEGGNGGDTSCSPAWQKARIEKKFGHPGDRNPMKDPAVAKKNHLSQINQKRPKTSASALKTWQNPLIRELRHKMIGCIRCKRMVVIQNFNKHYKGSRCQPNTQQ